MNNLTMFDAAGVKPDPGAIMCGIRMGLISPKAICDFAERAITAADSAADGLDDMLVFEGDADEALQCMKEHGYSEDGLSARKVRYAMLANLHSEGQDLLEDIEEVYSTFDYPADMDNLIYYMPSEAGSSSKESLIDNFHEFLDSEKKALQ